MELFCKYILSGFNIFMIPTAKSTIDCTSHFLFSRIHFFLALFSLSLFALSCETGNKSGDSLIIKDSTIISLPAATPIPTSEYNRIKHASEQWYDSLLRPANFNGGIIVAKAGNIIFERYNGTGHLGGTDSIKANTPTHIASVSKTFTAMAVLKLMQEGKLQLDDEFSKYFPAFNYTGVTIRSLLSHRSGLPNYLYFMEELGWDKKAFIQNKDVLDYLINRKSEIKDITSPNTSPIAIQIMFYWHCL